MKPLSPLDKEWFMGWSQALCRGDAAFFIPRCQAIFLVQTLSQSHHIILAIACILWCSQ
jgi:hypothetical protein